MPVGSKRQAMILALVVIVSLLASACTGATAAPTPTAPAPVTEPTAAEEAPVEEPVAEPTPTEEAMAAETSTEEAMAEETPVTDAEETPEGEAEGEATGEAVALPEVDALEVEGDIVTAGSSTVFPLSEAMAARFEDEGYAGNITIDSVGTGAGFERFCVAGETDIANASRAINEEESAACQEIGREPIEFRVGTDALAVVVSAENDFIEDVTLEELALIFSTAATWAEVNPDWPAEPIERFSPGTDSGTFDYFVEEVFEDDPEPLLNAENLQLSEDDNVLAQGVAGSPYAIGYFGYAYYQENEGALRALALDGVEPSAESVDAGEYALARPLFLYSDATVMTEKPQVAAFINFYLTFVDEEIEAAGYFPASGEALNQARQNWLDGTGQ